MKYDVWELVPELISTLKPEKLEAAIRAVKKTQNKIGNKKIREVLSSKSGIQLNASFKKEDGTEHKLTLRDVEIGAIGAGVIIAGLKVGDRTPIMCSDILIDGESVVKGGAKA